MTSAGSGYSGTPLATKLGLKPGWTVAVLDEPDGFRGLLRPLPDDLAFRATLRGRPDTVIGFFVAAAAFRRRLPAMSRAVFPAAFMWIAWPKRASGLPTDMTEDLIRDVALPTGLVDTKVCAIDETWSGLRLVHRRERRRREPPRR